MDFYTIVKNLFEDYGAEHFHDTVWEVTGVSYPADKLREIFLILPKNIQFIALEWGLSDTVFNDEVYKFLEKEISHGRNETLDDRT